MGKPGKVADIAAAFVAEFGEHAAQNTETGRLLGLAQDEPEEE